MVLSKRERFVFITTLACVGLFVANSFFVDPVRKKLGDLASDRKMLLGSLNEAELLIGNHKRMEKKWETMLSNGLRNDMEAESKVLDALRQWSADAYLSLTSIKPERISSDNKLKEMVFTVVGKGTLESVTRFLWQIETAELPIKIKDMQLGSSSTAGTGDSISLQLHLSALYLDETSKKVKQPKLEVENEDEL